MALSEKFEYQDFMDEEFPFKLQVRDNIALNSKIHTHDYLQICYVMRGECIHHIYGKKSTVVKGDVFSIFPFVEHEMQAVEGKDAKLIIIDFMPFFINDSMRDLAKMDGFIDFAYIESIVFSKDHLLPRLNLSPGAQMLVEQLIENMIKELELEEEGYRLSVRADLLKLLVTIGREFKYYLKGAKGNNSIKVHKNMFNTTVKYIEEHYEKEIRLEDMAKTAAMAPTYYSHVFKLIKGKTFIEYINQVRIHKAIEFLGASDMNITEICFAVGFNNLGHFNRMFKHITGVTPTAYRKKTGHS